MAKPTLEQELAERVEALDYEFVELERGGTRARPVFRLRIDRPESEPGQGVTAEDCTRVSRGVETYLDEHPEFGGSYVLEVSSPGVERPLVKAGDFERFSGRRLALKGYGPLAERGRRLEGELVGLTEEDGQEAVRLRLDDGETVNVPRDGIAKAHLVFEWEDRD